VRRAPLVDAAELARVLGVSRDFVYAHADELGVLRIGEPGQGRGRHQVLRFDVDAVLERLAACEAGRESARPEAASPQGQRRRHGRRLGTSAPLLPIRGDRR